MGIDVENAARSDDSRRFTLLDDGRSLDFVADRQLVVVVDRGLDIAARLLEIDCAAAFFASATTVSCGRVT